MAKAERVTVAKLVEMVDGYGGKYGVTILRDTMNSDPELFRNERPELPPQIMDGEPLRWQKGRSSLRWTT